MGEGFQDPLGIWQFHIRNHFQSPRIGGLFADPLMDHRHFHQLLTNFHGRIERRHGFLVDHRNFGAANISQLLVGHEIKVAPFKFDGSANNAAVDPEVLHDPKGHCGFPASRFAHQSHRFAGLDRAAEIHDRWNFIQPGEK